MSTPLNDPLAPDISNQRPGTNRNLIAALVLVTLIAVIVPLLMLAFLRTGDDETSQTLDVGSDQPTTTASTVPAPSDPLVAIAAAPTAVPPSSSGAAAQPAAAPVVSELAGDSPAVYRVTGIASSSALNVRQSAGSTNPLIGTIADNATGIAGTGRRVLVDGSEWREIKFNNGTGWVFAGYLALAPAPVASAAPTPTVTPAEVTYLAKSAAGLYDVIGIPTGASLNVRSSPGTSQRLLGTLPGDTAAVSATGGLALVGQTEWREIGFQNGLGWVNATYLMLIPEAPATVLLAPVASSTVGIVSIGSASDRLVLRADPGYDKAVVGSVGAPTVNIKTTGRLAQIDSEVWIEVATATVTGWVPQQLTIPEAQTVSSVLTSTGVASVAIDKVSVSDNGTVTIQVGNQVVTAASTTLVTTSGGAVTSIADWAATAKSATGPIVAELTVVSNQVTRIWVPV